MSQFVIEDGQGLYTGCLSLCVSSGNALRCFKGHFAYAWYSWYFTCDVKNHLRYSCASTESVEDGVLEPAAVHFGRMVSRSTRH